MSSPVFLTPDVLTCSASEWADESKRQAFTKSILEHLDWIKDLSQCIAWSPEMSEVIWDSPQQPPWRAEREIGLPLSQILLHRISELSIMYDSGPTPSCCSVTPNIVAQPSCSHMAAPALRLLHTIRPLMPLLVSRSAGSPIPATAVVSCSNTSTNVSCSAIHESPDWFKIATDIWFWPGDNSSDSWARFRVGLEKFGLCKYLAGEYPLREAHKFRMEPKFQRDLLAAPPDRRWEIVEALAKRLRMIRQQASADKGLHDEPFNDCRRFRVSKPERVHYVERENGILVFTDYFPKGKYSAAYR